MTRDDLKRMYGSTPESFQNRVAQTLANDRIAQPSSGAGRRGWRVALVVALIATLLVSAAVAAFSSQLADIFGWLYGAEKREEMLAGKIAQQPQSITLGGATYTIDEVVYIDDGLYCLGRITPAEGENVVLMAEDYQVTDAAGYGLYYGEDSCAPEGAPTYAQLAEQKGATILLAKAIGEAVGVDGGDVVGQGNVGYSMIPQPDGSIRFHCELPTGIAVEEGDVYVIRFWISSWEVLPDGTWLRDDPALPETYQGQAWEVTVEPKPAKEGQLW